MKHFLTILTRVHPKRRRMLQAAINSVKSQTDKDVQHLLIYDPTENGIGFPGANALLETAANIDGKYVMVLDDDDQLIDENFIHDLKEFIGNRSLDAVIFKAKYGDTILPPAEEFRAKSVIHAKIGSSCAVVSKALYDQCKYKWSVGVYGADFHFLKEVVEKGKGVEWWNYIGARTQTNIPNLRGISEDKVVERKPQKMRLERNLTWEKLVVEIEKIERSIPIDYACNVINPVNPMKINVVIPTIGARDRIFDTIDTLIVSKKPDVNIVVIVQNNDEMVKRLIARYSHPMIIKNREQRRIEIISTSINKGWVRCMNEAATKFDGAIFYAADDIVFLRETLSILECVMQRRFPDEDGIVLTSQSQTYIWGREGFFGAFGLIGNKFLNRFPGRQFLCPDYWGQWSDAEFRDYGVYTGKIVQAHNAKLIHFDALPDRRDDTSKLIYSNSLKSRNDYVKRWDLDYLWGKNFNRINKDDYPK